MHCAVLSAADKLILLFYHRVFCSFFILLLRHKQNETNADCRILADTEPIDFQDFLRQILPFPVDPRGETRLLVPNASGFAVCIEYNFLASAARSR